MRNKRKCKTKSGRKRKKGIKNMKETISIKIGMENKKLLERNWCERS